MAQDISNTEDVLDLRNIIEHFEELEADLEAAYADHHDDAEPDCADLELWFSEVAETDGHVYQSTAEEYLLLLALLADLEGYGGDHEWRGDWYPVSLVRDSYFKDHAQELADDMGAIDASANWPMNCIDWDRAARELRMDYSSVEFDGVTYWYR